MHITGTGVGQSTKTDMSERFVVLHPRLIELGFDDYVARRRAAGKTTLFDFGGRSAASFVKTLSNRLDEMAAFVPGLVYMRHRNGSLWLVPQQVGPYIEVSEIGLAVSSVPPFVTWDERTDGVCRAAAEIVRLVRRRGH